MPYSMPLEDSTTLIQFEDGTTMHDHLGTLRMNFEALVAVLARAALKDKSSAMVVSFLADSLETYLCVLADEVTRKFMDSKEKWL